MTGSTVDGRRRGRGSTDAIGLRRPSRGRHEARVGGGVVVVVVVMAIVMAMVMVVVMVNWSC